MEKDAAKNLEQIRFSLGPPERKLKTESKP
jgi:hypothetical protein